jgi:hypothetical protein
VIRQLALGATGLLGLALASELRVRHSTQATGIRWQRAPVAPRGSTQLGISIRSPQLDAFELDPHDGVSTLLQYPFDFVRLGAYWRRMEPSPGVFDTSELDWQLEAAAAANKRVILCVGALKTFGYPEFFAPSHVVELLPERTRIRPAQFGTLVDAATEFVERIVSRYRTAPQIVAWQVEHESVDPLGFEHSWRLDRDFVAAEVRAARQADPNRPILMNGFLPVSLPGAATQWWQTRDQGDSLAVALELADIIGMDFYPRVGVFSAGGRTAYLDASHSPWGLAAFDRVVRSGKRVMVTEGQAEPWETTVVPSSDPHRAPSSCTPEHLIANYNACLAHTHDLEAYLFWGAEYWLARQRAGDTSYLNAFARILETA